ncbi:hypothetical protein GcLGCM259_1801 [Glutamicibacter creatinolyticus]|uniref:Uncharacterized protein n=2 Tax=Glutamicibacter creatinolyticus TaxID=162496 RepID=A0A5B7WU82_9MICC|nr:hypothetical protein GcLGCM259_1801 [Glutamicibacter creatinolyticus]
MTSLEDAFREAGEQYAAQIRQRGQDTTPTGTAWLKDKIDNLEQPEQTMTSPTNNSEEFNRFFGIN